MHRILAAVLAALIGLFAHASAWGQGFVVPPERIPVTGSYSVKSVSIDATVREQAAEVQLAQVFRNNSPREMEVTYIFPVPADAVVTQFMLMVDGKEMPAKLLSKEEARSVYEGIVRSKKDPAILEYVGHGALQTGVFPLPAHGERKISLRYSQVCRKDRQTSELLVPLVAGKLSSKPVEELRVNVRIESGGKIKSVYSPTYSVNVQRSGDHSAIASFTQNHVGISEDLRLMWTVSDQAVGASVLSYRPKDGEDGYFLLLASPEVKTSEEKVSRKSVIFVLDKSGSMAGKKIEQARNALKFMLNNLREGDSFNIVVYDDKIETFRPEVQSFSERVRAEALSFVDSIHDGGSTNIDGALRRAMEMVGEPGRPSYVIFLTDGLPTAGEQNPARIADNARNANRGRSRLFCFGVGFDVNARLLDQLATENSGVTEYVRPNEDLEASLAKFYGKMTAPVLTDVKIEMAGADMGRIYPRELPDLFSGGQIVAVGRYRDGGQRTLKVRGKVSGREETFEYPVTLAGESREETYAFVEKLWANRRVGEIVNELDLKGKNQELIDELVRISRKHGILTPYTAFLADERTNLHAMRQNAKTAEEFAFEAKDGLALNPSGAAGVNLRAAKSELQLSEIPQQQGAQKFMKADGTYQVEFGCTVVGNNALFRRAGRWVDPSVTEEEEKKADVVEQFSDRYFELARSNAELRRYFALPEGCVVRSEGKVYKVDVAKGG